MAAIKLKTYLTRLKKTQSSLSREIGKSRSLINYWVASDATVEMTEAGIKIMLDTGFIVYESVGVNNEKES